MLRKAAIASLIAGLLACSPLHELPSPLITDPAQMAQALAVPTASDAFSATARVDYYADGKARKGKLFLMGNFPNRLRIEALSFTDDMLSLLVVKQDRFAYFERGKPECFAGPLCAAPVVARFPMASNPEMLLPLLLGRIPLLPAPEEQRIAFNRDTGLYVLTLLQGDITQEVSVEPNGMIPQQLRVLQDGLLQLDVTFSGRITTTKGTIPKQCRLVAPKEKLDLSIEYREFDWETQLPDSGFDFQCPSGSHLYELDCGGLR